MCLWGNVGEVFKIHDAAKGIKTNDKIRVVLEMRSPRIVKEVQSLAGKVAILSRFISKATVERSPQGWKEVTVDSRV